MNAVLKWAGIIGAVWLAVSILAAVFWATAGRRIFRKPPTQPRVVITRQHLGEDSTINGVNDVIRELRRRNRQNGGM